MLEEQVPVEGEGSLNFLRQSPQFAQLCQLVRAQPEMLPQVLSQIDTSNPELMQIIRNNQVVMIKSAKFLHHCLGCLFANVERVS